MKGWQVATLKELCVVDWGNTNLTKSAYVEGGEFLAVSAAGCDGRIGHKEHSKGTPVLSAIGAQCGKMFFPDEDFTAIKNTITLTPRTGVCIGRFLYHLLCFVVLPQRGAGQPFISKGDIQSFVVSVPPLPEQRRIVAILDEAFEGIATAKANAEKNLQNTRELGNQLRNGLFTRIAESTKRRRLGDVCTFVRGPFGGSLKKDCFVDDGYAVYEQSHAIYDQFTEVRYFVSEAKFGEMRRFELRPNDLIMSCSGTMGRVAIAPPDLRRGIINQALLKLTPSDSVEALYLKHWMESRDFQDALAQCSGGAAIQNVASVSVLKEIALPLPSVPDQRMAVDQLERFAAEAESLHGYYERKILALDELKSSLLHESFSGRLQGAR